jgi:hypothetical protein
MTDGLFGTTYSLRAGLPGEEGLVWSPPTRIVFNVLLTAQRSANKATISLANLDVESIGILDSDGAVVTLSAGFEALSGLIFQGSIAKRGVTTERSDQPIRSTVSTRDGATRITTIEAGEGEFELQNTRVNHSFSRRTTNRVIFQQLADDLNLTLFDASLIDLLTYSGGWPYQGRASGALDSLVRDIGAQWSIQAGQLLILKPNQNTAETVYVISPQSGLLGVPSKTKDGIELTTLLLAPLRPGRRIQVESNTVSGLYRIDEVNHKGDTRPGRFTSSIKAKVQT